MWRAWCCTRSGAASGRWWAARQFGVSAAGRVLAAFVFAASGFFVIHMPHPWGYTTGIVDALGLGAGLADRSRRPQRPQRRRLSLLSLVLTLQLLPGHFQLAFLTQTGIVLMAAWFAGRARSFVRDAGAES